MFHAAVISTLGNLTKELHCQTVAPTSWLDKYNILYYNIVYSNKTVKKKSWIIEYRGSIQSIGLYIYNILAINTLCIKRASINKI